MKYRVYARILSGIDNYLTPIWSGVLDIEADSKTKALNKASEILENKSEFDSRFQPQVEILEAEEENGL